MPVFYGEDYVTLIDNVVFDPSGGQFGPEVTGFSYDEFFGVGGETPAGGSFSLGGTVIVDLPFAGETELFRARLFGEIGATFGLNISASLDPGSVDAILPYEIVVAYPDLDPATAQAGDIIDLFFGNALTPGADPDAGFTTQFPSFTFNIDLIAELQARLAAELGALGANTSFEVFDFAVGTTIPILSVDTNRELANGDANPIELFGVTTPELVDNIPGLEPAFNDAGEFAGIGVPLNTFVSAPEAEAQPPADVEKEGDKQPEEEEPDLSGIDLGRIEIFVPNINTASSFVEGVFVTDPTRKAVYNEDGTIDVVEDLDQNGNNLGEGNRDDLAALTLDLDGIVTYATGGAFPPLELGASIGGSFGPAFFNAGFSYNLLDVELEAALPLEQEFTLTPKVETQLRFFEANPDGTKGAVKEVEVQMERKVLRFDETGTFRDAAIEARLRELAGESDLFAQDIELFLDFDAGITGAFTGQTASIGGRMIISRDGGQTFTELFTNAADPIAASSPALGQDQTVELTLDQDTVLGYRLFIGSGSAEVQEDFLIDFDKSDSVYVEEIEEISHFITETPFLDDLNTLNLVYDADDTFVDVVTKSTPIVTNRTGLEFDLSLILRGLAASASFTAGVDLGLFTLETGIGFELGPLFEEEFPLLNLDIVDIFNGTFQLEDTEITSFVLGGEAPAQDFGGAIQGTTGNDTLDGTEGDDLIVAFAGDDTINALGGDDVIAPGTGAGSVDGGAGSDMIDVSDYDGITFTQPVSNGFGLEPAGTRGGVALRHTDIQDLNFYRADGFFGDQVQYSSVERFRLTDRYDYVSLSGVAPNLASYELERVETLGGDDVIELFDTNIAEVLAGDGDDTVRILSLAHLNNSNPPDTYTGLFDGGDGNDTARVRADADLSEGEIQGLTIRNVENLFAETAVSFLGGDDGDNVLTGSDQMGATLTGRGGNDVLNGGALDDTIIGGAGADAMNGGDGIDTADYSGAATSVFVDLDFGGAGRGFRGEAQGDVLTGIERVVGSDFNDILIADDLEVDFGLPPSIFNPANTLEGGLGDDRLMAIDGSDALYGGEGDDLLARGGDQLQLFGNVYDGGDGFDIASLEVRDSFTETGTTTGTARFTYKVGSTFSSSNETKDRSVTVSTKWTHHNHIEVDLAEDGTGTVQYIEEDASANILATRIAGTASYSHATPRSIVDFFPPYRVVTTTYDNNITDKSLASLDNDSVSFTKSSSFSNTSGSGKITFEGQVPNGADRRIAGTETLIDIEGIIASKGNDILNGNSQDNAFFGNGGVDLIRGGDGNDRLGFGEGQALADVFSFPGSSGAQSPGSDPRVFKNLVERLVFLNPDGTESSDGRNDWTPVGKIQINASGGVQDIGSFLWGQGGIDTLDMRFDRGISFFPDSSENFAHVRLEIPLTNAPINNFTGESVFYGFAEWFDGAGTRQTFATTYGIENVIGSENDDQITGDRRDNVIEGLGGADIMDGLGGSDTLSYALAKEGVALNFRTEGQTMVLDNAQTNVTGAGDAKGDFAQNFEQYVGSAHGDFANIDVVTAMTSRFYPVSFQYVTHVQVGTTGFPSFDPIYSQIVRTAFTSFTIAGVSLASVNHRVNLDLGDGNDHAEISGGGAHIVDLGAGDDTASLRNGGHSINAGSGDDVITIGEPDQLVHLNASTQVTRIDGGEGEDTVILNGTRFHQLTIDDGVATISQGIVPQMSETVFDFTDPKLGARSINFGGEIEVQQARADALRDGGPRYELSNVEFVVINGQRVRVDNPDPIVDADKTLSIIEDQIDAYDLGIRVSSADLDAGATFEIVALPQTAEIALPGGAALIEGEIVSAADLAALQVVPGQDFDTGTDALVYRRVGDAPEDTQTVALPEPVRGVALGITSHLGEVQIDPPFVPPTLIHGVNLNPNPVTDQHAQVLNFDAMPTGAITIEMLMQSQTPIQDGGPRMHFISYAVTGSNNELLMWADQGVAGTTIGLHYNGVTVDTGIDSSALFDTELHRFSVTIDPDADLVAVYIDGAEAFSGAVALTSIDAGGSLNFGQEQDEVGGRFDPNQIVRTELADVRIWDGVRSQPDIAANAFRELPSPASETGLVANWQADPLNQGVMADALGGAPLVLAGDPAITAYEFENPQPLAPSRIVPADQQGDPVTIAVSEVPANGVVFYMAPDPGLQAVGITFLVEVSVAVGDLLTPDQLEGLYFRADPNFSGDAGSFAYTVRDDVSHRQLSATLGQDFYLGTDADLRDGIATQTIGFDVAPANDAPVIKNLLFPISPGGDLTGKVRVQDAEDDAFMVQVVDAPTHGTVVVNPDGSFAYQQNQNIDFAGASFIEDSFSVQATEVPSGSAGGAALAAVSPGGQSAVQQQVIRIINPAFHNDIVFDPTNPDVYFDDEGNPINLGGLGTDDRIVGHDGPDGLYGFGGHDRLEGLAGNDSLDGGDGNDTLTGAEGDDTLSGGAGADVLDGGTGEDAVDYAGSDAAVQVILNIFANGGHATGDILSGFEHAFGSEHADFFRGDAGANRLEGRGGADYLQGMGGDDFLFGGDSDDILEGGQGNDTLDGGDGQDFFSLLDATGAVVLDMSDMANSSADYAGDTLISVENVLGISVHANTITGDDGANILIGGEQADLLDGGRGADILIGLGGDDTLLGGGAADVLVGSDDEDLMDGGSGADLFLSGLGADRMTGGLGPDSFLFEDDGADVVTDFNAAEGDLLIFYGEGHAFTDLVFSADANGDAMIEYGTGSSIVFEGVTQAELQPVPDEQPAWVLFA